MNISVVIIALNEEHIIEKCLKAASQITDDIIVIDSGSIDATIDIAKQYTSKVYSEKWRGYGATRNLGTSYAKYNWIFSLDCDEILDAQLISSINNSQFQDGYIYKVGFKSNFWGNWMNFGGLRLYYRRRIYNKHEHQWNNNKVHERLTHEKTTPFRKLKGSILHFSYNSVEDLKNKFDSYAKLSAENLISNNKRPSYIKRIFAPSFRFLKTYVFQLGFLDGKAGWIYAIESMKMVRQRYRYFDQELHKSF